jgi:NAD(P)-dependent dehydrogenase (short-subunit alcohol dehydrogenase family)
MLSPWEGCGAQAPPFPGAGAAVQAINVKGVFLCTKHAIPYLRQAGGGSIVNISSIYGIIGAQDIPS